MARLTGFGAALAVLFLPLAEPASAQDAPQEIRAQLTPRESTTLAAEIGAKVERLGAREGERFRKGQILAAFDCSVQKSQVTEARAALTAAERTVAVDRRLFELKSIGGLEKDLAAAEEEKARAKVAEGMAVLAKCTIFAPFDGRVAEQKVHPQQFVQLGQPLMDILDDSVLELEFVVPSRWLAWLKPGYAFQAAIDETGRTYAANLSRIGARIDPVTQTVKVVGVISGPHADLLAGMSGRILITPPPGLAH
ncbi:efflux RND transporter periplasmic adaptor subunit [Telmatospirillum siberiense]|uniref:Efflux RND transporter periplasmic adaptor subunit n=1 Tax=Telmatospirillum siberiense TaxID=382514 RepID=A0A2N3PZQ3_9PROT|nr:efflux RND transporter periplasmic adaptor subunit [Telmatospirillum siberiense]PKU25886.1 efflux RND transporter periplasmic adaptor subunit [Telmatospirillum siberiense]